MTALCVPARAKLTLGKWEVSEANDFVAASHASAGAVTGGTPPTDRSVSRRLGGVRETRPMITLTLWNRRRRRAGVALVTLFPLFVILLVPSVSAQRAPIPAPDGL